MCLVIIVLNSVLLCPSEALPQQTKTLTGSLLMQQSVQSNARKKNQSKFYSGKKKKHTLKAQVIYHPKSKQIIGIDVLNGSQHDIKLARKTVKKFKHCEYVMTDLGYYGLEQDGFKLLMPIKKKKNSPLFKAEKKYNRMIGKIRVVIEHINSQLKRFRILSERYRNRRKRFGLRINLIAALVNRINLQ